MNFSYGVIAAVGVLVAISIGLISMSPDQVLEPRAVSEAKEKICTMDYVPVCGIDGETYGNMCTLEAAGVDFVHKGECGIDDPIVKPRTPLEVEPEPEPEPVMETTETYPTSLTISLPEGSGVPGCEETDECYIPYEVDVAVGALITWSNDDTAAHTVTSGNISDGHDGLFDSSLFMAGATYEYTFDTAGTFDYFCMVHPWMTGVVNVHDSETVMEPEPAPEPAPEPEPTAEVTTTIVSIPVGTAIPGCEETNECYIPYEVSVSVGSTVAWSNDDSAAHTVTSGNVEAGPTGVFDSGLFMAGGSFEHTFDSEGTFDYFCMVHPWMTGMVIVS